VVVVPQSAIQRSTGAADIRVCNPCTQKAVDLSFLVVVSELSFGHCVSTISRGNVWKFLPNRRPGENSRLETELCAGPGKHQGGVVDVGDVARVGIRRRRCQLEIHQTVQNGLPMCKNLCLIVIARGVAEGEGDVLGKRGGGGKGVSSNNRQLGVVDSRRLGAV